MSLDTWSSSVNDYWQVAPISSFLNKTPKAYKKVLKREGFATKKTMSKQEDLFCPRMELVRMLEAADENKTFDKFMDLPPELRVAVYTMYLQDIESRRYPDDAIPAQPPLTKVSKIVRSESLPVFYDVCNFNTALNMKEGLECYKEPTDPSNVRFLNAASTLTYPDGLSAPSQPLDHSLSHLYVRAWARDRGRFYEVYLYDVKYGNTADGVGMSVKRIYLNGPDEVDLEDEPGQVDEEMRHRGSQTLELFRRRGNKLMLQPTDMSEFEKLRFDLDNRM